MRRPAFWKLKSFQIRITLLSTILSGIVLIVFGATGLMLIYRNGLESIDRDIREMGHRELTRRPPEEHWDQLNHALGGVSGHKPGTVEILLMREPGEILFQSDEWPDELTLARIREPDRVDILELPPDRIHPPPPHHRPGARGENPEEELPLLPDPRPPHHLTFSKFPTIRTESKSWRLGAIGNGDLTMAVCVDLAELNEDIRKIIGIYLSIFPVVLLLTAAGGWIISRRALYPVNKLTDMAEKLTARGLDQRVSVDVVDAEFARLISVFNGMLDRLERSFQQAVRFSADAAHELKTPLTIIQGELEQAIQDAPPDSDLQRRFSNLLEETVRLKSITRKLLLLARADAGKLPIHAETVNFNALLTDVLSDLIDMETGLELIQNIQPDCLIMGDANLLEQLLQNLTGNAVKYNVPKGNIRVDLTKDGNHVKLAVTNSGETIPPGDCEKVFQRFYRGSESRNRRVDGLGLGLALSREIAIAHGGELRLESSRDNVTVFVLTLPG